MKAVKWIDISIVCMLNAVCLRRRNTVKRFQFQVRVNLNICIALYSLTIIQRSYIYIFNRLPTLHIHRKANVILLISKEIRFVKCI